MPSHGEHPWVMIPDDAFLDPSPWPQYGHLSRITVTGDPNAVPILWDRKLFLLEILAQDSPSTWLNLLWTCDIFCVSWHQPPFPPSLLHWKKTYEESKALPDSFGFLLIVLHSRFHAYISHTCYLTFVSCFSEDPRVTLEHRWQDRDFELAHVPPGEWCVFTERPS